MTWKRLFKRFLCAYFYIGHKWRPTLRNTMTCERCKTTVWNTAKVIHKHKRIRHNVFGKKFFQRT